MCRVLCEEKKGVGSWKNKSYKPQGMTEEKKIPLSSPFIKGGLRGILQFTLTALSIPLVTESLVTAAQRPGGLLFRFSGEEGRGFKKTPGSADKQLSGGKFLS